MIRLDGEVFVLLPEVLRFAVHSSMPLSDTLR
jgi:hypothetical protein